MEANEGAQDGNGDGAGTGVESPGQTQDGNGDGSGIGNESNSGDGKGTRITGTKIGSGRAEERRRSARNRTRLVDTMWETGETWTWVENEKKTYQVKKKGFVQ